MFKSPISDGSNIKHAGVILLIFASLCAGFLGGWFGSRSQNGNLGSSSSQIVLKESELISEIAKNVGPSVVSVDVVAESTQTDLFGFERSIERQGAGTGFIISKEGIIITNRHVVPQGVTNVAVTLSDGTKLDKVEVIGRTSNNDSLDVAFLKITDTKGKDLTPVKIGDSSKVQVGDKVVAIGNALGQFQNTVTSGIISGHGRNVLAGDSTGSNAEQLQDLFQTDAAINQGNSGGPLVNIDGEVIAINTAVATGGAENIGFAIPISNVEGLIKSVLETGKLKRAYLGVRYVPITDEYATEFKLDVKRGAYIVPNDNSGASVVKGSPADKAGLKEKDIITKIDNVELDEKSNLTSVLGRYRVGDKVKLTVARDGRTITLEVTLAEAPES